MDLGYTGGLDEVKAAKPKVAILLGADQGALTRADLPEDCMVIYIGKHLMGCSIVVKPILIITSRILSAF